MTIKNSDISKEYKAIVIGGSAGSFPVISNILSQLPKDFHLPIIICCHRLKHIRNGFTEALEIKSVKTIEEPNDKDSIKKGMVYLAPANYHMSIELGYSFSLTTEDMIHNSRPSIDVTFESAAYVYKEKLIGILLTGANKDGAHGMKKVKERGGLTIVQDPMESIIDTMPRAAINSTTIDYVFKTSDIINFITKLRSKSI